MSTDYARALGARLRAIRLQQGLSLHGVEQKSQGRWKAVVVGSYERGDRSVTVQRLSELADFYGVPILELLPEADPAEAPAEAQRIVLDLERLALIPAEQAGPLARFAGALQRMRGDYNGKVLSVRADDLQTLSLVYDRSPGDLLDLLAGWGVVAGAEPSARAGRAGASRGGRRGGCRRRRRRSGAPASRWSTRGSRAANRRR